MKHIILGAGNLGKDLLIEINQQCQGDAEILSRSRGTDATNLSTTLDQIEAKKPDVVWYCIGGGSVAESKPSAPTYKEAMALNFKLPIYLAGNLPLKTKLIFFSSDYAADPSRPRHPMYQGKPQSDYAIHKQHMETEVTRMNRQGCSIIRVGSLYGTHKPERTFPGKILTNFAFNDTKIRLPSNIVVPTPTRWLAHKLVQDLDLLTKHDISQILHCAPNGGVSVKDWAKFVLQGFRDQSAFEWGKEYFDDERPYLSSLGCSFGHTPHWYDLFQLYFKPEWYMPKELRGLIPGAIKTLGR